jgi:hypothetical protein
MAVPGADRLVPFFSNPTLRYDGAALGVVDSEDNVRSMALSAPIVAGLLASKQLPDLTATPPAEVTTVRTKYTKGKNRTVRITAALLTKGSKALPFQPAEIYFSRGRKGEFKLRAAGRTDQRGTFSLVENLTFPAGYFYRVCYPSYTTTQLCSAPTDLTKVR